MENRWALITGASSGIGYAYAEEMAKRGYPLVIVSNEAEAIGQKAELLHQTYQVNVCAFYRDLAIPGAAEELYHTCREKGIEVEVLINNAGMFFFRETVEEKSKVVEKMLYLHVTTPTQLCYYFGQDMKKRRQGYILNMSSLSAWLPYPGIGLYASTKRYLKNFSRALQAELSDYGVHVAVVCPGAVCTNLYALSDDLKRLAVNLQIMMSPERLSHQAIKALFRGRTVLVPGLINKIALPIVLLLPVNVVRWLMRKSRLLPLVE